MNTGALNWTYCQIPFAVAFPSGTRAYVPTSAYNISIALQSAFQRQHDAPPHSHRNRLCVWEGQARSRSLREAVCCNVTLILLGTLLKGHPSPHLLVNLLTAGSF